MNRRELLSPLALSWRALAWFAPIGVIATLVTVPTVAGSGVVSWRWWMVALLAQGACTAVVAVARPFARGTASVLIGLGLAGAVRGAVIAGAAGWLGVLPDPSWPSRIANSTLITIIWLGLLGAILRWSRDYAAQYRTLVERAITVERANREGSAIDPVVLLSWSGVKARIDDATRRARGELDASQGDGEALSSAAMIIREAIDEQVRPASHALWSKPVPELPRLRGRMLLVEALSPWRPPLPEVLLALGLVVGVGSLVRLGVATAIPYTITYLVTVAVLLAASAALAARMGHDRVIAIGTLAALVPVTYLTGDLIARLPGVQSDVIGGALVAVQTPATTIVVTMIMRLVLERRSVLDSLQQRIDVATVSQLAGASMIREDSAQLGTYVHHSVQSELAALAIQLAEAAHTRDAVVMEEVRGRVRERLERMEAIDANQPPWLRASTGPERIAEIALAWDGIATIDVDLPTIDALRPDQWHLAAQVVEEGIANAIRHGGARQISVRGSVVNGACVLVIDDDGALGSSVPGLGSAWLDVVAAGDWSRSHAHGRTRLEATLR